MSKYLERLDKINKLTKSNKLRRFSTRPYRYIKGQLIRLISSRNKMSYVAQSTTFFDRDMKLLLPAGLDIYIFGTKTHSSEIRLAKYLLNHLNSHSTFIDVGAHYGYYSLLANAMSCAAIYSFEASKNTYQILKKNVVKYDDILTYNIAICDSEKEVKFYEFPTLFSENNTANIDQFKSTDWIQSNKPQIITVKGMSLDMFFQQNDIIPDFIKIDVEGGEFDTIKGLYSTLQKYSPTLSMEFIFENKSYSLEAYNYLTSFNYIPFLILDEGQLEEILDINSLGNNIHLESENIIFKKRE